MFFLLIVCDKGNGNPGTYSPTPLHPHPFFTSHGLVDRPGAWLLPLLMQSRPVLDSISLDIGPEGKVGAATSTALANPAGTDPLPCTTNLAILALALPRTHIGVLLDNSPDFLPYPLTLRDTVHTAQDVVSQVWQEKERVVLAAVLVCQLFLSGKTAQDEVDKSGNLGGGGTVPAVFVSEVEGRQ